MVTKTSFEIKDFLMDALKEKEIVELHTKAGTVLAFKRNNEIAAKAGNEFFFGDLCRGAYCEGSVEEIASFIHDYMKGESEIMELRTVFSKDDVFLMTDELTILMAHFNRKFDRRFTWADTVMLMKQCAASFEIQDE